MAIHYENYRRFSKGQGFIGPACGAVSAQAVSERWFAVDCPDCKLMLCGKRVVCRDSRVGTIEVRERNGVWIKIDGGIGEWTSLDVLDLDWAPMPPTSEIFSEVEES
jgi:hypothetical protein